MNFKSSGLHRRNISAPMLPMPTEPNVRPTRPTPICCVFFANSVGPPRVSWSLVIILPESARMKVRIAAATGRRTPSGVIASAMPATVQASTSTLS